MANNKKDAPGNEKINADTPSDPNTPATQGGESGAQVSANGNEPEGASIISKEKEAEITVRGLTNTFPAIFQTLLAEYLKAYGLEVILIDELAILRGNQIQPDGSTPNPLALTDAEKEKIAVDFLNSNPQMQNLLDPHKVSLKIAEMSLNATPPNQIAREDVIFARKGIQETTFSKTEWNMLGKNKEGWSMIADEPDEVKALHARNSK